MDGILNRITTKTRFCGATVGVGNGAKVTVTTGRVLDIASDGSKDIGVRVDVIVGDRRLLISVCIVRLVNVVTLSIGMAWLDDIAEN